MVKDDKISTGGAPSPRRVSAAASLRDPSALASLAWSRATTGCPAMVRRGEGAVPVEIVASFTGDQLDLALGRLNVVHAALLAGRTVETFLARWRILECFRADEPDDRNSGSLRPNQDALEPGS